MIYDEPSWMISLGTSWSKIFFIADWTIIFISTIIIVAIKDKNSLFYHGYWTLILTLYLLNYKIKPT